MSVLVPVLGKTILPQPKPAPQIEVASGFHVGKFVEHFEALVEAHGGVDQLRTLGLALGMGGRLGTGDAADENATNLLERLKTERQRLVDSGAARRRAVVDESEVQPLYELPPRWVWTQLGEVITVIRGASPRPKGDPRFFSSSRTKFPWVKISDFRRHGDGQTLFDTDEFLTPEGAERSVLVKRGTLLLTNSATIGVPMFMGMDGYIHDGFLAFPHFPGEIDQRFFFLQLRYLTVHLTSEARGLAQLNLNSDIVRRSPLALPPLAEQKRIVAKVDELMRLLGDLEAKQVRKRETQTRLRTAALDVLTSAEGPEAFETAWKRVAENFGVLFQQTESVGDLRRTILNMAATAQLVRAAPGSASEARAALARLGDVDPRMTTRPPAASDWTEIRGWLTVPLAAVLREPLANGRSVPDDAEGFPVLRLSALRGRFLDFEERKRGAWTAKDAAPFVVQPGDVLFVRGNGAIRLVGRACLAGEPPEPVAFPDTAIRARPHPDVLDSSWLWFVWESTVVRQQIEGRAKTTAGIFKVSQDDLYAVQVPVPTLAEQRRIVAKVEHLMKLCDDLEAQLHRAETTAAKLVEAVVAEMVA